MVGSNQQAAARPRIVGRYALFDEIAAGGMATIHLGRLVGPVGFSRTVAIKTLHPQFAKDPEFVEMFLEEARLASRIQHPNVISTVDVATAEGEVFLVMEYVAGESLAKLVRSALKKGDPMPVDIAVSILAGMLHGLHATHEAKNEQLEPMHIVHRDVSPQNVLVGLDGIARIFDFGVAKAAAMRSQSTSDGQMKGKLSYMSPEQLNSRDVDRRTDVFAAGVVAWECLAGRRLFAGSDPGEVLAKVLTLDIPAPIDVLSSVPRALSNTVMRALERSPEQRWQTARDFAIELERNVVLAAPHMVGDWVAQHAGDALQDRRLRVESVERASVDLGHVGPGAAAAAAAELIGPASARSFAPAEPPDLAGMGSSTSRSSTLTVSSSAAVNATTTVRQLLFALLIGALGVAVVGGVWYWQQHTLDEADGRPSPASLPEPADTPTGSARDPGRGSSAAPDNGTPPPMVEVDSLPETDEAPDGGTMIAGADPSRGGVPSRARRAGKRPAHTARVNAATPPPKAPRPATPITAPAAQNPECSPPWYIDAKGIQRLKPKCLEDGTR
ncbi:MAG TPA: protein kinase [Polyangiaceae bacterium]|nr:protein kinase [Polyangiaceae bacterium]